MPEVHFVGEIRSCSGFLPPRLALTGGSLSSLSANWEIHTRDERIWRHLEGDRSGKTWLAQREEPNEVASWNTPLDVTFAFSSVDAWPVLLITVMETDAYERQDLGGYGVLRLPTTPGEHVREVPISRPRGGWSDAVTAFFVGGRPRYDHPALALASGAHSRYGHRTVSMGVVEVRISVAVQGFHEADMAHVRFDVDRSVGANDAASVCRGCPPSTQGGAGAEADDDADDVDDADERRPADQQALLRKTD